MMETNDLFVNKKTLNSGYIYFDDPRKANRWKDVLIKNRVQHTIFVLHTNGELYFCFKMFRMRYQFLDLCRQLKEVLTCK